MADKLYSSRENRDKAATELRAKGKTVRVGRVRNQQLHPMYVEDWKGPEKDQTGLGNTVYRTFHPILYTLEEVCETSGVGWPD